jgi:hypothetical protein
MQEATDLGHVFQQHLLVDLGPVHDDGWFCAAFGSKAGQSGHGRKILALRRPVMWNGRARVGLIDKGLAGEDPSAGSIANRPRATLAPSLSRMMMTMV